MSMIITKFSVLNIAGKSQYSGKRPNDIYSLKLGKMRVSYHFRINLRGYSWPLLSLLTLFICLLQVPRWDKTLFIFNKSSAWNDRRQSKERVCKNMINPFSLQFVPCNLILLVLRYFKRRQRLRSKSLFSVKCHWKFTTV